MHLPLIYVDTNVYKFAATELPRFRPRATTLEWGHTTHPVVVHDMVTVNPNENIDNPLLAKEASLLPELAAMGVAGAVKYVTSLETLMELSRLRNLDSASGRFYGAPVDVADAPVRYGRVLFGGPWGNPKELQLEFLKSLPNQRFLELQKLTGAYQGAQPLNPNQLLDAYFIWCAEHNKCNYFLTLDLKLCRMLKGKQSSVQIVSPSELISLLNVP